MERTHCRNLGRGLEAGKDVGECFESWIFDVQLLRHVLNMLWLLVFHRHVFVRDTIDFICLENAHISA